MQRATRSTASSIRREGNQSRPSRSARRGGVADKSRAADKGRAADKSKVADKSRAADKGRAAVDVERDAGPGDASRPATKRPRKKRPARAKRAAKAPQGRAGAAGEDRSRVLLQRLVSVMPDAVITLKASGALGQWSVGASRMTGRRRREVQRRGFASVFRDEAVCERLLADIESRGRVTDCEAILVNAAGEDVPTRISGTRLKGIRPDGKGRGRRHKSAGSRGGAAPPDAERYLIVLHDLTEVHRIRSRLIETEKLSAMAKIAGSVAHEFRNPLNSLFLNTDLLEDELEPRKEISKSIAPTLAAIREEIERLNQIITHYLSLSKIVSAEPETIDIRDVVAEFAAEWQDRAQECGIKLRVRPDDATHPVLADPSQVRRILVNLVENAFDALGDSVKQDGRRAGTVTLLIRRMRRSVKLTVKDNGPGIPAETRERVFEPFVTSKSGGSGLGLYLVREIVLASGGSMSLSSTDGRGTSVSVRWPIAGPVTSGDGAKGGQGAGRKGSV